MKLLSPYLYLAMFFHTSHALPFRIRGNDQPSTEDAVIGDGEVIGIQPSHPSRRSATVELFFEDGSLSGDLRDEIRQHAANLTDFLLSTRRTLHQRPELMYNEQETSLVVQKILSDLGISFTTGWAINQHPDVHPGPGGFGVVADIGTGQEPCVLLRADMDALPILERTESIDSFRSQSDGKMHACGHDAHTTMLLGAAAVLKSMEASIAGTVRLMFQPAEEGGAGAKRMREEGILQLEPKPAHAFGMHVWPTLPSGVVAGRPGPLLAACERFEVLIAGVGGHAAMPHLTVSVQMDVSMSAFRNSSRSLFQVDPIVTASAIIMNLQTIVSRNVSPLESGVCSITKIEAGEAFNIIPHSALLRGTIRALSTETLLDLRSRVEHIIQTTAKVYGANVTIDYSRDFYPPTVNDPELYESFAKHVGALVAEDGVTLETEPTMGAEDFSFVAESIPSTFFLLGQGSGTNPPTHYGLHHPHFALDESVLPRGVELHVNLALRALRKLHHPEEDVAATA